MMSAHIAGAGLDEEQPATLSPPIVDGLLSGSSGSAGWS